MHGSGGMGPNIEMWAREFNAIGVATFALDGFTGRGLTQTSTNQALLGRLNFILDIYRGLDVLAKHPRVDPQRIVLMGFSRGGQAALYASLKRFHQLWNKSGVEFAAYVPFYPDCATSFAGDTDLADQPIRIFGGTVDDYNPIALCKTYAERLKAAGRDVQVTEYPNAPHSFDNPLGPADRDALAAVAERAQLQDRRGAGGHADQRLDQGAVHLQGRLRRARAASRPRSGGDPAGQAGGDGLRAHGVQAELAATFSAVLPGPRFQRAPE